MNARSERYLEEMGLAPVWKLRGPKRARGPGIPDQEKKSGESRSGAPAVLKPPPARRPPQILPPIPGLVAAARLDLADDRAARILRMDWPELKTAVAACQACGLRKTCTQTVFGVGDEHADWLLVGEAPGAEEDARGEPFVGQAGRLLDNMLAALGLARGENVYICNVLKCRPPGNRNPEPFEVAQCTPHLLRQLELIRPKLILAMGRFAVQALLSTEASIASLRGRLHRYQGVPLIVTYHPAYLLRNLPDKAKAWEDLCFARRSIAALQSRTASPV
ncbi:MAG: uracil-DNA glycosylase [Betaproteobacteria bacterium]|nr:MAG: uracil-DNA glycosylase [Betaproteobacteria bacterium]